MVTSSQFFSAVVERSDKFLALFPHRFDYIYAPHAELGQIPEWQTESRHLLSDRLIEQGAYLFGVRFGAQTQYCLLDIDAGSAYHPAQDPLAIARILGALEAIGIVSAVVCSSSYSGGLHIYFPLSQAQSSWELATVVATLLENSGFGVKPGQLEIFPNPKPYIVEGSPTLFNAHRLPMQVGSYLLNSDFQPVWSDRQTFVVQWQLAQQKNAVDAKTLKLLLKQAKRRHYLISGKADKFLNDLNAEIELGWTGAGQTNHLLGRITMRAYIFQHLFSGGDPLEGEKLVEEIVNTAQALPGYAQWCNHQHEIQDRAREWSRCIEKSHYFHYGDSKGKYRTKGEGTDLEPTVELPTWNQQQSEAARERIRKAIAEMLEGSKLPSGATARFQALTRCGIGGRSLYRHRDLWHPQHLVESPPHPPTTCTELWVDCAGGTSTHSSPTSLLPANGDNCITDKALSDSAAAVLHLVGDNEVEAVSDLGNQPRLSQGSSYVQPMLFDAQSWLEVSQEASQTAHQRVDRLRSEAQDATHIYRMQQYLNSGDPILMAEAFAWAEVNPNVLNFASVSLPSLPGQEPSSLSTTDFSDLLVAISVHLRRLRWDSQQVNRHLSILFSKEKQSMLTDSELSQWLEFLDLQI